MQSETYIDLAESRRIGDRLGIDWRQFSIQQFQQGLNVEHGRVAREPELDSINDDVLLSGKIALPHLIEYPDYYARQAVMNKEADEYWANV
jgi:hypothetical protein